MEFQQEEMRILINKKKLKWDSEFFHLNIAKIEANSIAFDINKEMEDLCIEDWDLVYIETPFSKENKVPNSFGQLVDIKCIYEILIDNHVPYIQSEYVTICKEYSEELYSLALQAGHKSRYKTDTHFAKGEFERFYKTWVQNSLNGEIADCVFVYQGKDKIKGFITLKIMDDSCNIGLFAVDSSTRGKGIGHTLMDAAMNFALRNGKQIIRVATQLDNLGACRFYEKYGFKLISTTSIFHKWIK